MSVRYDSQHPIPPPTTHPDNEEFWKGVKNNQLLFQRCADCGQWLHPPRPMCPKCRSLNTEWAPSRGKGRISSWVTYRETPHPGLRVPYSVVLVELEEGIRIISNMLDVSPEQIHIGMPVEVVFDKVTDELILPKFKKISE